MFLKWLKIPHSKNFTAQKLKFLDVTKGICVKCRGARLFMPITECAHCRWSDRQLLAAETVARPGMTL